MDYAARPAVSKLTNNPSANILSARQLITGIITQLVPIKNMLFFYLHWSYLLANKTKGDHSFRNRKLVNNWWYATEMVLFLLSSNSDSRVKIMDFRLHVQAGRHIWHHVVIIQRSSTLLLKSSLVVVATQRNNNDITKDSARI